MIRPFTANPLERESRLAYFAHPETPMSQAAETMNAGAEVQKNPVLKQYLAIFDDPLVRSRHPVLLKPVDRGYFYSLLLNQGIDPKLVDYKKAKKENITNPVLPLGMIDPAIMMDSDKVGARVNGFMDKDNLTKLGSTQGTLTRGGNFMKLLVAAKKEWDVGKSPSDPLVVDAVVDYYVFCRTSLDATLKANGVLVPKEQRIGVGFGDNLRRDEYLALLTLTWNGKGAGVVTAAKTRTAGLRALIGGRDVQVKRTLDIYSDRSFREVGPSDTLDRFGVTLGPSLTSDYFRAFTGKEPIPSAQTWTTRPDHALKFLQLRLPKTPGNQQFLKGLEWHVGMLSLLPEGTPQPSAIVGVEADDIKAMLALVSQSCMECEQVATRSQEQREKLMVSSGLKLDKTIEGVGSEMWKTMLDFRQNPVLSGAMWITAAIAMKMAWDTMTAPRARWSRWLFLTAAGGAVYGMYQQKKTGKAWWDDLMKNSSDYMNKDKQKPVEEQTFVNYWTQKLKLEDNWLTTNHPGAKKNHADAVIATLQEQPVSLVMDWYEKYRTKQTTTLPQEFSGKQRRMFGEMDAKARAKLFHGVLTEFFKERGEYVLEHHMDSMYAPTGVSDPVALGYDYMKDKYVKNVIYEVIATNFLEQFQITIDTQNPTNINVAGINLNDANILEHDDIKALQTKNPKAYMLLVRFLAEYSPVVREQKSYNWEMMWVFYQEADPEILRRMGQDEPARMLEKTRDAFAPAKK